MVVRLNNIFHSPDTAVLFFLFPLHVFMCVSHLPICVTPPVCLPLQVCHCLSILRERPCKPADGPGLAWSWCPGGSLAADLDNVIRAYLRSVTQEATDAIRLDVIELGAG